VSLRLTWTPQALDQLAAAAEWSRPQAEAVVNAMEWMAETGFSLGHPVAGTEERYWPVPPLGVFYAIVANELQVVEIADRRRRDARRP
jgi:hypothetical protein